MKGLDLIKARLAKGGGLGCDVDDTLASSVEQWFISLQDKFGNPEKLSPQEMVQKYRYTQNVPCWQTPQALDHIKMLLNSNNFQGSFSVIEGAPKAMAEIYQIKPIKLYITIRPESVAQGTALWLRGANFPHAEILALPPDIPFEKADEWKAQVLEYLYPEIEGMIDNSGHIVKALNSSYRGKFFLFGHTTVPRQDLDIRCAPTWPDMVQQIKSAYIL